MRIHECRTGVQRHCRYSDFSTYTMCVWVFLSEKPTITSLPNVWVRCREEPNEILQHVLFYFGTLSVCFHLSPSLRSQIHKFGIWLRGSSLCSPTCRPIRICLMCKSHAKVSLLLQVCQYLQVMWSIYCSNISCDSCSSVFLKLTVASD